MTSSEGQGVTAQHPSQRRWWHQAECRDLPLELFFHDALVEEAKTVCFDCPVRQDCLFAARHEEAFFGDEDIAGVRGGLSAADRVLLRQMERQMERGEA